MSSALVMSLTALGFTQTSVTADRFWFDVIGEAAPDTDGVNRDSISKNSMEKRFFICIYPLKFMLTAYQIYEYNSIERDI